VERQNGPRKHGLCQEKLVVPGEKGCVRGKRGDLEVHDGEGVGGG
jgi:hypothetical protein